MNDFKRDFLNSESKGALNIKILQYFFPSANIRKSCADDDKNGIDFWADDLRIQVKNGNGFSKKWFIEWKNIYGKGWAIKYLNNPPDYLLRVNHEDSKFEALLIDKEELLLILNAKGKIFENRMKTAIGWNVDHSTICCKTLKGELNNYGNEN